MQLIHDRNTSQGLRNQGASQAACPLTTAAETPAEGALARYPHTGENVKKSSLGKGRLQHSTEEKKKKNRSLLAVGVV